jgi:CubicO group peptidase (beta-lactamase class C family)
MGSVLIARDDELVFSRGYGSANLEWNIPNSPSTKFRIGSLTKQFTAASILLLEERGKIRIEDPVRVYLPDAPAAWDNVTVFSLLTHTSGIPNFTSFPNYQSWKVFPASAAEVVAFFRDKPLDFPAGEQFSYSNSGYALLGYLIERISGLSYEQFVAENIFVPLGMKDSGYDSNTIIANRAAGYSPGAGGPVNAAFIDMSVPYAAGGLYSTTLDLWRWEQALFGGKLLSAGSLLKMTTPYKGNYGFGLAVGTASARRVIFHNGGIEGFNTFLAYYPEDKMTIVVLGNLNGPAPDQMGPTLGKLAHGEDVGRH